MRKPPIIAYVRSADRERGAAYSVDEKGTYRRVSVVPRDVLEMPRRYHVKPLNPILKAGPR